VAGDDGKAHLRGFGYGVGPRAFGHDGAGGQTAWVDPDTGLSFVYLTNGIDRHLLRQWKRIRSIATRAARCAEKVE
jgi:CubicO group peptidase (beta-lactamase class C family)